MIVCSYSLSLSLSHTHTHKGGRRAEPDTDCFETICRALGDGKPFVHEPGRSTPD